MIADILPGPFHNIQSLKNCGVTSVQPYMYMLQNDQQTEKNVTCQAVLANEALNDP